MNRLLSVEEKSSLNLVLAAAVLYAMGNGKLSAFQNCDFLALLLCWSNSNVFEQKS